MRGAGRVNVWCLSAADLPKLLYRQFPIIGTGYRGLEIATDNRVRRILCLFWDDLLNYYKKTHSKNVLLQT